MAFTNLTEGILTTTTQGDSLPNTAPLIIDSIHWTGPTAKGDVCKLTEQTGAVLFHRQAAASMADVTPTIFEGGRCVRGIIMTSLAAGTVNVVLR